MKPNASKGFSCLEREGTPPRLQETGGQAGYDALPLELTVRVISGFGRRFLELMSKVDQLMPLLDTLAIDGVITQKHHTVQKSAFIKSVRSIAGGVRIFANGLCRRMHILAENEAAKEADKEAARAATVTARGSGEAASGNGHDFTGSTASAEPRADAASASIGERSASSAPRQSARQMVGESLSACAGEAAERSNLAPTTASTGEFV